jgi:hypothetical protein
LAKTLKPVQRQTAFDEQVVKHDFIVITHAQIRLEKLCPHLHTASVITELRIGNFKAFGETQRVPIKPLTLIFGANSSGKSSIIHSLLLAHHGMETGEYDVGRPELVGDGVDLGGFRRYVHRHDPRSTVKLCLEINVKQEDLTRQLGGEENEILPFLKCSQFGLCLSLGCRQQAIEEIGVSINREPVLRISRLDSGRFRAVPVAPSQGFLRRVYLAMLRLSASWCLQELLSEYPSEPSKMADSAATELSKFGDVFAKVMEEHEFTFKKSILRDCAPPCMRELRDDSGDDVNDDSLVGLYRKSEPKGSPPYWAEARSVRHNLSAMMEFCTVRIAEALRSVSYLGPFRWVPERHATTRGVQGPRIGGSGSLAWKLLSQNPEVRAVVNTWLGPEKLGTPYRLKPRGMNYQDQEPVGILDGEDDLAQRLRENPDLPELGFEDIRSGTVLNHCDIGFGVGQVLPVLVNAGALKEHLIAIEQPELHLHPAHQAELGDVFIESALGERKNTFLLETHSEHLILRILRRVRETTEANEGKREPVKLQVKPEHISVIFVEPKAEGSMVRQLPVTPDGDFGAPWPGGFFAERLQDLP